MADEATGEVGRALPMWGRVLVLVVGAYFAHATAFREPLFYEYSSGETYVLYGVACLTMLGVLPAVLGRGILQPNEGGHGFNVRRPLLWASALMVAASVVVHVMPHSVDAEAVCISAALALSALSLLVWVCWWGGADRFIALALLASFTFVAEIRTSELFPSSLQHACEQALKTCGRRVRGAKTPPTELEAVRAVCRSDGDYKSYPLHMDLEEQGVAVTCDRRLGFQAVGGFTVPSGGRGDSAARVR